MLRHQVHPNTRAARLRRRRRALEFTIREVAHLVGLSIPGLSLIERGLRPLTHHREEEIRAALDLLEARHQAPRPGRKLAPPSRPSTSSVVQRQEDGHDAA
jgi:transcriptional regulator with XRE-family HTH domain